MVGIKDFEMPYNCYDCDLHNYHECDLTSESIEEDYCWNGDSREKHCPLREVEAIQKVDYENRLKTDIVAMLEEIKEQLREMHEDFFGTEHFDEAYGVSDSMDVIQERINDLVGKDGNIRERKQNEESN